MSIRPGELKGGKLIGGGLNSCPIPMAPPLNLIGFDSKSSSSCCIELEAERLLSSGLGKSLNTNFSKAFLAATFDAKGTALMMPLTIFVSACLIYEVS